MKPIKMFGLSALAALMAMAFVGASSAMAESTTLCSSDIAEVEVGECEPITHVHEVSVGKGKLLSSIVTIECEVLFLGDTVAGTSAPLKIKGNFTYPMAGCETTSGTLCEVIETSASATIEVLRTAHELAEVKGTAEVNAHCGALINCTYNGVGLVGHGLGPLLSTSANGNVNISEQTTNKTGGAFCPKTAKLDLTTTPLVETYIRAGAIYCVEFEHAHGFYSDNQCKNKLKGRTGQFNLVLAKGNPPVGAWKCVHILVPPLKTGLYENKACTEDDKSNTSLYELGKILP